ncbi:ABC-2 transporter permease [Clostridium sp. BJN0013]|uniref:ABC-2 transporter permease n=1 Tax=Clostridium sp. BJN0013 TaxID=3236840 RepID=UPI0034C5BA64
MRSLILKDIYNIMHGAKSMLLLTIVLTVAIIPLAGLPSYVVANIVIYSMMVVTTFAFDDNSKWTRYAMVMPITKKEVVRSKFCMLMIFCLLGILSGICFGIVGGIITQKFSISNTDNISDLIFSGIIGVIISAICGSINIPLIFKYGSESARQLIIVAFVMPTALAFTIYKIGMLLNITIPSEVVSMLKYIAPILIMLFMYFMYKLSCNIFINKDL